MYFVRHLHISAKGPHNWFYQSFLFHNFAPFDLIFGFNLTAWAIICDSFSLLAVRKSTDFLVKIFNFVTRPRLTKRCTQYPVKHYDGAFCFPFSQKAPRKILDRVLNTPVTLIKILPTSVHIYCLCNIHIFLYKIVDNISVRWVIGIGWIIPPEITLTYIESLQRTTEKLLQGKFFPSNWKHDKHHVQHMNFIH